MHWWIMDSIYNVFVFPKSKEKRNKRGEVSIRNLQLTPSLASTRLESTQSPQRFKPPLQIRLQIRFGLETHADADERRVHLGVAHGSPFNQALDAAEAGRVTEEAQGAGEAASESFGPHAEGEDGAEPMWHLVG